MTSDEIKLIRYNRGFTPRDLAEYVGVAVSTVARWGNGTEPLPAFTAVLERMRDADQKKIQEKKDGN